MEEGHPFHPSFETQQRGIVTEGWHGSSGLGTSIPFVDYDPGYVADWDRTEADLGCGSCPSCPGIHVQLYRMSVVRRYSPERSIWKSLTWRQL